MTVKDINIDYFKTKQDLGLFASSTSYSDFFFPKHFHNYYSFIYIQSGVNKGFTEKNKYLISQGGVLMINPSDLHAGCSYEEKNLHFHSVRIALEFMNSFLSENEITLLSEPYFITTPVYDSKLSDLLSQLFLSIKGEKALETRSLCTEFLFYAIERYSVNLEIIKSQKLPSLKNAIDYMMDNISETIRLDELAKSCYMSPFHFCRVFKKQHGISPFQYLRNLRVEQAKPLMANQKLTYAAIRSGFYDQSHFIKCFKRIEGVPPSLFSAF